MMARRNSHTYQTAAAAHSKVIAARRELAAEQARAAQEEPMHRYPHSIPQPCPAPGALSCPDMSSAMTQVLEHLSCQNQLLIDLLGAVNSLTAALLVQKDKF